MIYRHKYRIHKQRLLNTIQLFRLAFSTFSLPESLTSFSCKKCKLDTIYCRFLGGLSHLYCNDLGEIVCHCNYQSVKVAKAVEKIIEMLVYNILAVVKKN